MVERLSKVILLELDPGQRSGTGVRAAALKRFLETEGHAVEILSPPPRKLRQFPRERFSLRARLTRRLLRRRNLPHFWDCVADLLEPLLRRRRYDAVIGCGQPAAYVLTRGLPGLKILDMANLLYLEQYYGGAQNLADVEETFEKELRLFESVDYVLSPHELLGDFVLAQLARPDLARKLVTARLGCEPAALRARFALPLRIVCAGSYYYMQDPFLLAQLARISPFPIDCFGPQDPNRAFLPARLNYRGYAPSLDFLAGYQLGLVTVARDLLRQHSPATKFASYFAHGLPVLFPDWMKEGHSYPDCALPYDESNFPAQVERMAEAALWERMSSAAVERARTLTWDQVLRPLGELLRRGLP